MRLLYHSNGKLYKYIDHSYNDAGYIYPFHGKKGICLTISSKREQARRKNLNPGQILALGFLVLIVVGGLLLTLPACSATGQSLGLLKGMFTATSAVCVTGLTLIEAGVDLSPLGQGVLLALIQVGGLGFMAFASLGMVLLGRKISLRGRLLLGEAMNQSNMKGMVRLSLWFFLMALAIELAGAAVLSIRFIPRYGVGKGIWMSIFTAISAFCNAGFDLFGQYNSVISMQGDPTVIITLTLLILFGGMGFAVILELLSLGRGNRRLSLHAKLVLIMNAVLLFGGALMVYLLEYSNPATLAAEGMTGTDKVANAFMQSMTCRTAGFASIDQGAMKPATKMLSCFLMFVGASPASTGGGIKTTTLAVSLLMIWSVIRGREHITLFGKEVSQDTARRAVALMFIALAFALVVTTAIVILEDSHGFDTLDLGYETISAITTTGLSAMGTGNLRVSSQILLMPLMYLGRVGPLTLAVALAHRANSRVQNRVRHPEENVMIG